MTRRCLGWLACAVGALVPALAAAGEESPADASSVADPVRLQLVTPPLRMPGLHRGISLRVYLPPDYARVTRRYPVLYLFDAQNLFDARTSYAGEWEIDEAMDREFARSGFAAIVIGIDHGGEQRINELSAWPNANFGEGRFDAVLADTVRVLKPFIDSAYRTRSDRASTLVGGSSLGGLASLYAVLQRPDVFGRAIVLSPSLWISEQAYWLARRAPTVDDTRIFLYGGTEEDEDLPAALERMKAVLDRRPGLRTDLVIGPGQGHNEAAWKETFPEALRWAFALESPSSGE